MWGGPTGILAGMQTAAVLWAGFKAINFAATIRNWLQAIGVMNVNAGVVNVNGAAGVPGTPAGTVPGVLAAARVIVPAVLSGIVEGGTGAGLAFGAMALGGWAGSQIADRYHVVPYDPENDRWSKMREEQKEAPQMSLGAGAGTPTGGPSTEAARSYNELQEALKGGEGSSEKIQTNVQGASSSADRIRDAIQAGITPAQQIKQIIESIRPPNMTPTSGYPASPVSPPPPVHVTYNITGHDSNSIAKAVKDHAHEIAKHVASVWSSQNATEMAV